MISVLQSDNIFPSLTTSSQGYLVKKREGRPGNKGRGPGPGGPGPVGMGGDRPGIGRDPPTRQN